MTARLTALVAKWREDAKRAAELGDSVKAGNFGEWYAIEERCKQHAVELEAALAAPQDEVSLDGLAVEIVRWQRETFPASTVESTVTHLAREAEELFAAPHDSEELADVFLLCCAVADKLGVSLAEVAATKLSKNKAWTWGKPDADGVVEHVEMVMP